MSSMTNQSPTLDDLLKQIEAENSQEMSLDEPDYSPRQVSAGLEDIAVHEVSPQTSSPSPLSMDMPGGGVPQLSRQFIGGGNTVNEQMIHPSSEGLDARQRALPKLSYRMLGSIVAALVLTVGLSSAVYLSQQPQDVRQYAADPSARIDPEIEQFRADTTEQAGDEVMQEGDDIAARTSTAQGVPTSQPWWQSPVLIAGTAILVSALLILAVFLHWLFAI
jgi:hypothetical protein